MELLQKLAASLCGLEEADEVLSALCQAAFDDLCLRLREGVTPEKCGKTFWIAAAMLAADAWQKGRGTANIASFTAGSIHVQAGQGDGRLSGTAMELLRPWLRDEGFAFQGVSS